MFGRRKVAALLGEFLGTGVLTLLILSVQRSQLGLQYFVAIAAGLTFMLLTFVLGRTSGGYFNPVITLGLWTARKLTTVRALLYIVVQFLGAYAAFGLYSYYSNTHLSSVGGHYSGRILIAEAVGTGIFTFSYAATLYQSYSHAARSVFAGLAYTVGILAASTAALGLLNPAVALGIKAWVWGTYVLGPVLGAIIGINLYVWVFAGPEAATFVTPVDVAPARASATTTSTKFVKKPATKKKSARK